MCVWYVLTLYYLHSSYGPYRAGFRPPRNVTARVQTQLLSLLWSPDQDADWAFLSLNGPITKILSVMVPAFPGSGPEQGDSAWPRFGLSQ